MPYQLLRPVVLASAVGLTLAASASAADLHAPKTTPATPIPAASVCTESEGIPTDAFGFTTGSDLGDPGSFGPSLTYGGGFGARDGSAANHGAMLQGSYGVIPCLEIGPYVLGASTDTALGGRRSGSYGTGAGA